MDPGKPAGAAGNPAGETSPPGRGERMPEMKLWARKTQLPEHGPGRHRTQVALSGWRRRCSASRKDAGRIARPGRAPEAVEKAGRMTLADDYAAVEIYAAGIVALSACAPKDMPLEDLTAVINVQCPTGISSSWAPDLAQEFRGGLPNPCPCEGEPDRRMHYLFRC